MVFIGYFCVHNLFKSPMFLYLGFIYLVELYFSPRGSIFRIFNKELLLGVFIIFIFSLLISPKRTVHQHQK
jgi:hypothetical protein